MQITELKITTGRVDGNWQGVLQWVNPVSSFEKVRIVYLSQLGSIVTPVYPVDENDGTVVDLTAGEDFWLHDGIIEDTRYCYSIFVYAGGVWGLATQNSTGVIDNSLSAPTMVIHASNGGVVLPSHLVTATRTRGAVLLGAGISTDSEGRAIFHGGVGMPTSTSTDTVLWLGDEITVKVESSPNTLVFEKVVTVIPKMITPDWFDVHVDNGAASVVLPAIPTIPAGVNPASTSDTTPSFIWNHVPDADENPNEGRVHYAIELDRVNTFDSTDYSLLKTVEASDVAAFEYAMGPSFDTWVAFPSNGLKIAAGEEARIKFTCPMPLAEASWKWRVYATDLTLA